MFHMFRMFRLIVDVSLLDYGPLGHTFPGEELVKLINKAAVDGDLTSRAKQRLEWVSNRAQPWLF